MTKRTSGAGDRMNAWMVTAYGGPEVLVRGEMEVPRPKKGQVLIEVRAVALNPYDYLLRNGIAKLFTGFRFPKVFGGDFAGVVVASMDPTFREGQRVYGFANVFFGQPGALSEHLAVSTKYVRPLPAALSFEEAAALPSAALTALSGLRSCGEIAGKRMLVVGATGGVGHLALQMAKLRGARPTGVCSGRNEALARELGADEVIDYRERPIVSQGETYDVIYDAAAKLHYAEAREHLSERGVYCTTAEGVRPAVESVFSTLRRTRMTLSSWRGRQSDFEELEELLTAGCRPVLGEVFDFADVDKAFERLESGGFTGKLVIRVGTTEESG